ncbi:cdh-7, partial [Pristionchus pacificus]|uniref:Cdh-7 n=1 Tax=Pristionchus pacificus TaxID=54126 RepID=A0A2A6CU28_PRIPA
HPEFVDATALGSSFNLTARVVDGVGNTQRATIIVNIKKEMNTDRKLVFEQINNRTGELRYKGEIKKDDQEFDLKILVSSSTSFAVVPVHILIRGIGSFVPKFTRKDNVVTISRTLPVESVIHEFTATDLDSDAELKFQILTTTAKDMIGTPLQDPDFSRLFRLESSQSKGRLILDEDISALEVLSLRVEVQVSDQRHPDEIPDRATLLILVTALKSSQPEIPLLQLNRMPELITLPANIDVGSYVYTVAAKPSIVDGARSEFWYELNDGKQFLEINSNTGELHTVASLRNEREVEAHVVVSHLNSSTSVQAPLIIRTVPVLEHSPVFASSFYEHTIDEATPPGTKVMTVSASDEDASDVIQFNLEGMDADQFEINEKGELHLRTLLDRETKPKIKLFVVAIDSTGRFDVAPVTLFVLDVNDSEPFFNSRSLVSSVMEDAPIGSLVVRAQATDRDLSSSLRYDIRVPNESSMLSKLIKVDNNGTVTTTGPLQGLDGNVMFEVIVSDGKHTAIAEVNLEIMRNFDCHPQFDMETEQGGNFVFEIQENAPIKFALGKVKAEAMDEKCVLEFTLWDEEKNEFVYNTADISIDNATGELKTNRVFDAEMDDVRIPVVLGLRSQGHTAKMGAELRIIDLNDNPLRFAVDEIHFKVPENSPNGTFIGAIEAYDKDAIDHIFYHFDEPNNIFTVNATSGQIHLIGAIDREKADKHSFTIIATNSNTFSSLHSAMIRVNVHIQDMNDNPPEFSIKDHIMIMNDATVAGAALLRMRAEDPDEEKDGQQIFYRIAGTTFEYRRVVHPVDEVFSIGEKTGDLRLEKNVKDFTGGRFNILIAASDKNNTKGHERVAVVKRYLRTNVEIRTKFIKAIVHSPSDVVTAQVAGAPSRMTRKVLGEIVNKLSSATDSDAHVVAVEFTTELGQTVKDASSLYIVFTGRDSGEPIPAEKMVAKMDRLRAEGVKNLPLVRADQHYSASPDHKETIAMVSSLAPVFIVLLFFITLLAIVIFIFSIMVCVYRRRYYSLKKAKEDVMAIKNSQKTPEIQRPMLAIKNGSDRNPSSTISTPSIVDSCYRSGKYDVQEAKMDVVNPEDD